MTRARRKAREDAMKVLYQLELNAELSLEQALRLFDSHFGGERDPFVERLVRGVLGKLPEIDAKLTETSENWRLDRMGAIDRMILRLGAYELLYCDDIPATVSIDEMIELAKSFGTEHSPAFVNGILDRIKQGLQAPNKAP